MNTSTVLVGTLAADPVNRVTGTGTPVCSIRLASTPRVYDRDSEAWKDGDTVWMTVTAWRQLALNCVASLHKGDQVVVAGRLRQRSWTTPEGQERTVTEMEADNIGLELTRHAAISRRVRKTEEPAAPEGVDPATGEISPGVMEEGTEDASEETAPDDVSSLLQPA